MGEQTKQCNPGNGGDEHWVQVRSAQEEQEWKRGPKELGQVDQTMLIPRMDAMLSKVGGIRVVDKVVDRGDDGFFEDFCDGKFLMGIERRVHADSNERC